MLKVTLDTNGLINGLDGDDESRSPFETLREFEQLGYIKLALTSRILQDKADDKDADRVKRHNAVANCFPKHSAPFRIGMSSIGGLDHLVGEGEPNIDLLFGISNRSHVSPHTIADIDHLHAHFYAGYDYFLTFDIPILKKARVLAGIGIKVMSPTTFVGTIKKALTSTTGDCPDLDAHLGRQLDMAFR